MFCVTFNSSSANAFKLGKPKILSSGKGLNILWGVTNITVKTIFNICYRCNLYRSQNLARLSPMQLGARPITKTKPFIVILDHRIRVTLLNRSVINQLFTL